MGLSVMKVRQKRSRHKWEELMQQSTRVKCQSKEDNIPAHEHDLDLVSQAIHSIEEES